MYERTKRAAQQGVSFLDTILRGRSLEILGLEILGLEILGLEILGLEILWLDRKPSKLGR